jgi:transcriptional regulator with XRE-family HTH domain
MMRPVHLRMARAALGWTLKDLADKADVNLNTVSRYEAGFEILTGTMLKLEDVLRAEGVIFIDEDEEFLPAIRIRKEPPFKTQMRSPETAFRIRKQKTKPKKPRKRMD